MAPRAELKVVVAGVGVGVVEGGEGGGVAFLGSAPIGRLWGDRSRALVPPNEQGAGGLAEMDRADRSTGRWCVRCCFGEVWVGSQ